MTKKTVGALVEALKELIRTGVLAVIPVVIDGLIADSLNLRMVWIAGAIAVLRALDKLLHEKDIETPLDLESLDVLKK